MFEFDEEHRMVQTALRQFVEKEIAPHVEAMESGEMLPYELMRKMARTFGLPDLVQSAWKRRKERKAAAAGSAEPEKKSRADAGLGLGDPALQAVLGIELCRVCPGFFLSFGASLGLCGMSILAKGTDEQRERWALPILTLDKIGAWGLTEPESGSDAFRMRTVAKPDPSGDYVINGSKTFITNAPYADTMLVYAKIDRGEDRKPIHAFILERGMKGVSTGKPMKKLGHRSSPTGEIFLEDVRVGKEHLLGGVEKDPSAQAALDTLQNERGSAPIMAYGMIDRCLEECIRYAKVRKAHGRPIAEYQLIQRHIARMYVALENVKNMLMKQLSSERTGTRLSAQEYSAMKLYCGETAVQVALDAIQVHGGFGYLTEGKVEMFLRDAKLLQIGGGTDEIQILTIARQLLAE